MEGEVGERSLVAGEDDLAEPRLAFTGTRALLHDGRGIGLEGLTIEDFKSVDERIDSRVHKVLGPENSVRSRTSAPKSGYSSGLS